MSFLNYKIKAAATAWYKKTFLIYRALYTKKKFEVKAMESNMYAPRSELI